RLINLICDRALLAGFAARTSRITAEMMVQAADSLDVQTPVSATCRSRKWRGSFAAAAAVMLAASVFGVGGTAWVYQRFASPVVHAESVSPSVVHAPSASTVPPQSAGPASLPSDAELTIL